jgi:MarR family transcriptional regulator, transcriptional regulator for hemolysin
MSDTLSTMPRPTQTPLGLALAQTAKAVGRAFDDALGAAGGSRPAWLILLALKTGQPSTQTDLAAAVGIREATLSHHLTALEADGLVARVRVPDNRRVQQVTLTPAGDQQFLVLAKAAQAYDHQLCAGLTDRDTAALRRILDRMRANVTTLDIG